MSDSSESGGESGCACLEDAVSSGDSSEESGGIEACVQSNSSGFTSSDITYVIDGEVADEDVASYLAESKVTSEHGNGANWSEVLLRTDSVDVENGKLVVRLSTISSYDAIDFYESKGADRSKAPSFIEGIIITKDNKVIFGVQNSERYDGMFSTIPAGHMGYAKKSMTNPMHNSFYSQLAKETGLGPWDVNNVRLIGYNHSPQGGVGYTFVANTDKTFDEMVSYHRDAKGSDRHYRIDQVENSKAALGTFISNNYDRITPSTIQSLTTYLNTPGGPQ